MTCERGLHPSLRHTCSGALDPALKLLGQVRCRHRRSPEVLYDDLLDVPIALMRRLDGQQRLRALVAGLADPQQDAYSVKAMSTCWGAAMAKRAGQETLRGAGLRHWASNTYPAA